MAEEAVSELGLERDGEEDNEDCIEVPMPTLTASARPNFGRGARSPEKASGSAHRTPCDFRANIPLAGFS
jgi:hypothetical protein